MSILLDTTVCSEYLKARPGSRTYSRLVQHSGQLRASRLTCAELYALGYRTNAKKLDEIDELLKELGVLEFDEECAREYGRIHARLAERGLAAGTIDLMIAATAIVHDVPLVTFDRGLLALVNVLPELRLQDWPT
jgi:predicted nucleic acid-binding protein